MKVSANTGRRTEERLGVFIGHLSCYRVTSEHRLPPSTTPLSNTRAYIQSQSTNGGREKVSLRQKGPLPDQKVENSKKKIKINKKKI